MPKTRAQIQAEMQVIEARLRVLTVPTRILDSTFGPQRAFVLDGARLRAAICGRRAGKTYGVAAWLVLGALAFPETLQLYIHLNRAEAKRTIWQTLKIIDKEYNLGGTFREADLEYHLQNGSIVWVTGCPDSTHIENFRGKAYKRVAIDEAASYPSYLTHLIDEVLMPALMDYQGDLALIGTPGVSPTGYLHGVANGQVQGWSQSHHWTAYDNPHLPHAAAEIEGMLARRGWTKDHPTFRREYLGLWVADLGMLVYHSFSPQTSVVDVLPDLGPWHHVLGIDLGASEEKPTTAYALLAYSDRCRTAFVRETKGEAGATPSSIADQINRYDAEYKLEAIVADAGALGAGYVRELRERHRLPVEPAEKANKRGYQELFNGDLAGEGLRLVRAGTTNLQAEMAVLPWADDTKTQEKKGVPNHHCDAALYGWRRCRQYHAIPDGPPAPKLGTPEWMAAEEARFDSFLDNDFKSKKSRPWWHKRPRH